MTKHVHLLLTPDAPGRVSALMQAFGVNYNYRHYISEKWQIFSEALYERYSSDVQASPIARINYEAEVSVSFLYVF
jgi:outer membrane scaffolding protein for murein synthesis (MipA/OmpV family)